MTKKFSKKMIRKANAMFVHEEPKTLSKEMIRKANAMFVHEEPKILSPVYKNGPT